ncbi:Ankyrin repeat domain protein [Entamoeba marina]
MSKNPFVMGLYQIDQFPVLSNNSPLEHTTPLHLAVYLKRSDLLPFIIPLIPINTVDVHGKTALMIACEHGDEIMAKELLRNQASALVMDNQGICAITAALRHGYSELAVLLLENGIVDAGLLTDIRGYSLLHYACFCHDTIALQRINEICDLTIYLNDSCNSGVSTPLHISALSGSTAMCKWLLQHGADVNSENEMGETPLIVSLKHRNYDCVTLLLQYANPQIPDNYGQLPLHHAATSNELDIIKKVANSFTQAFNKTDTHGNYPFHCSTQSNSPNVLHFFFSREKNILQRANSYGLTALHSAVACGTEQSVKTLLEYGASVTVRSLRGTTPFLLAVSNNQLECAQILFNYDPSVIHDIDNSGCTSFHYACQTGAFEMLEYLYQIAPSLLNVVNYLNELPLHYACLGGHISVVHKLIEWGCIVNTKTITGRTAFHYAVYGGHLQLLGLLQIPQLVDHFGLTCAHYCCALGNPHLLQKIIQIFPNCLDVVDTCGRLPLHIAIIFNDAISVNLRGLDPINSALHRGHIHIYELLLGVRPERGTVIGKMIATSPILWEHPSGWALGIVNGEYGVFEINKGNVVELDNEEKAVLTELLSLRKFSKRSKKNRSLSLPDNENNQQQTLNPSELLFIENGKHPNP